MAVTVCPPRPLQMLRQTDPVRTTYLDPLSAWFNLGDATSADGGCLEVMGIRSLTLLRSAVGVAGLAGLDRLYSFMLVHKLQAVVNHYRSRLVRSDPHSSGTRWSRLLECFPVVRLVGGRPRCDAFRSPVSLFLRCAQESGAGDVLAGARRALGPPVGLPEAGLQGYGEALARASKAVVWAQLQEALTGVGQAQLLRRHIASELSGDANLDRRAACETLKARNPCALALASTEPLLYRCARMIVRAATSWPSRSRRATPLS